jgi:flagellar basal body-associated protein FliL
MKRLNLLIGIAIFTFNIGVGFVWFWLSFSKLPVALFNSSPAKESASTTVSPEPPAKPLMRASAN